MWVQTLRVVENYVHVKAEVGHLTRAPTVIPMISVAVLSAARFIVAAHNVLQN